MLQLGREGAEETSGVRNRYWQEVRLSTRIYVLVVVVPLMAAAHEAVLVIFIITEGRVRLCYASG